MDAPFAGPPSIQDWLLTARVANRQVNDDWQGAAFYLRAAASTDVPVAFEVNATFLPGWIAARFPGWNLVSFTGTYAVPQWMFHILNAKPVPQPFFPGKVGLYFAYLATRTWGALPVMGIDTDQPTVCVGHSLGASTALLFGMLLNYFGHPVQGVYGLASPHVGDDELVAGIPFPAYQLLAVDDPVAVLPPSEKIDLFLPSKLAGILPFVIPKPASLGGFAQWPYPYGLRQNGCIGGYTSLYVNNFARAIYDLATGRYQPHLSEVYIQRLMNCSRCQDKLPGAGGYPAPWALWRLRTAPDCTPGAALPAPVAPLDPPGLAVVRSLSCIAPCFPPFNPAWSQ